LAIGSQSFLSVGSWGPPLNVESEIKLVHKMDIERQNMQEICFVDEFEIASCIVTAASKNKRSDKVHI